MIVGAWGPVVFQVSGNRAFTYSEFTRKSHARWETHPTLIGTQTSEFLGPGQDEIEFQIILSKMLGVDPTATYELLRQLIRRGQRFPLILGGLPVSLNLWYIEEIMGTSSIFAPGTGRILWTELTVLAKEYT